jgi:hypothetical protein
MISLEHFDMAYWEAIRRVSQDGKLEVECGSTKAAESLRAKFNLFKAVLKHAGREEDFRQASQIHSKVKGTKLVLYTSDKSWDAELLRRALEGR